MTPALGQVFDQLSEQILEDHPDCFRRIDHAVEFDFGSDRRLIFESDERLGHSSQSRIDGLEECRAELRGEAPAREPHELADGFEAEVMEGIEDVVGEAQGAAIGNAGKRRWSWSGAMMGAASVERSAKAQARRGVGRDGDSAPSRKRLSASVTRSARFSKP